MLRRIILHWTAGTYTPNQVDFKHYHFLINGEGKLYFGAYPPEANIVCQTGHYAMHTRGGNTGSIGLALCGMMGYVSPTNCGPCPITKAQTEFCFAICADLCKFYAFLPVKDCITTHYHFNKKHNIKTGKIDIVHLPPYPDIKTHEMEDFIISKVRWYFKRKG